MKGSDDGRDFQLLYIHVRIRQEYGQSMSTLMPLALWSHGYSNVFVAVQSETVTVVCRL